MTDQQHIDAEMERDIQVLGLTAPRVTPEQIDALMRGVRYEVQVVAGTTTTLATAIAANGFTLAIGMTACASRRTSMLSWAPSTPSRMPKPRPAKSCGSWKGGGSSVN
ncbi:hypothetical protein C3B79_2179 [Aeromonas hydrophila]|nr:hypothetical protein C3B79_2179 [Aeromonas hydrophila]